MKLKNGERISLLNHYSSPKGSFPPGTLMQVGEVIDVKEAQQLVDGGYAKPMVEKTEETKPAPDQKPAEDKDDSSTTDDKKGNVIKNIMSRSRKG